MTRVLVAETTGPNGANLVRDLLENGRAPVPFVRSGGALLLAAILAMGCDSDMGDSDAGTDAGGRDAATIELYAACEDTMPPGTTALPQVASTLIATIDPDRAVLLSPGSQNPASERGELMYREMELDAYSVGAGQDRQTRTDLGGGPVPDTGRRSIAYFVHYADFQLVDDESPTRLALADTAGIPGGLRAQEAYLPRAVSAMNRTLARMMRSERPYDFAIISGDCADSAQANELRWVIELMNGTAGLHTDSGDDDDLIAGPDNDPKDPFDPTAFPGPWLYAAGNHDVLVVGISLPDSRLEEAAIGTEPISGTRNYRQRWGAVSTRSVIADPERRLVSRQDIVDALLADTGGPGPVGHGFEASDDISLGANYEYDAIPGLLRVIQLDTSDDTGGSSGLVHRPTVDGFLVPALERAQADGVLVIMASHHATSSIDVFRGQISTTVVPDAVPPRELETIVAGYDNVIAWFVGHNHVNRIRTIAGPDSTRPGYWEIMTSAMADYPGQARVIELVDNGDDTLSIFTTLVDFDEDSCAERRYRRLMVMEHVTRWGGGVNLQPSSLNVELLRPTPASASLAVAGATGSDRIESETTLRGE